MIKKIYIIVLLSLTHSNFQNAGQNTPKNKAAEQALIEKKIAAKRKQLNRYKKDLKKLKKRSGQTIQTQELENKIKALEKELKKEERTSNSFFLQTSDMTETRATMDVNHAQDIYNAKYHDNPFDAVTDIHDKKHAYFRNH